MYTEIANGEQRKQLTSRLLSMRPLISKSSSSSPKGLSSDSATCIAHYGLYTNCTKKFWNSIRSSVSSNQFKRQSSLLFQ